MKLTTNYLKQLIKEQLQREEALDALVSAYDTEMGTNRWKPKEAVQQLVTRGDIKKLLKAIFPDGVRDFGQALTSRDQIEILRVIKQHKRIQKSKKQ